MRHIQTSPSPADESSPGGSPTAGRLAGLLFVGSGLLTFGYLFLPTPELLSRTTLMGICGIAVALGVFALVAPWERWSPRATLWLALAAFGLIAAGNYAGSQEPWTFGIFFVVAFVWLGMFHPPGAPAWFAAPAAIAYVTPILLRPDSSALGASSAVITIPVAVLVGESIAWIAARERRSRERAAALARAALTVGSQLSEDAVLQTLVDEGRRMLNSEHALLSRLDPDAMVIRRVFQSGVSDAVEPVLRSLEGASYASFPARDRLESGEDPIVVEDAENSDVLPRELTQRLRTRSFIMIPLHFEGQLVGVLSLGESSRGRRYSANDIAFARTIGAQARVAVQNAVLYERALLAAKTDHLTGLENRGAFQESFDRELQRARRYGRSLSLALLDTDNLKEVNDSWGHQAGDRVLVGLANVLQRTIRQGDSAYRIGGDEFALLLPETDPSGAATLAERVRRVVERARLGVGEDLALTVSIGVASFPEHASSTDELFSRADSMLYEVKTNRGNAVSVVPRARTFRERSMFGLDVHQILRERRIVVRYQPIVDLAGRTLAGYEAFCRIDPELGETPTPALFRAAGVLGLLESLDRLCHEVILDSASNLPDETLLFVNVSPATLESVEFDPQAVLKGFTKRGVEPERIVFEVIEQGRSPQSSTLWRSLERCKRAGAKVALDDLGAGAADIELLGRIPFDFVKVDIGVAQWGDGPATRHKLLHGLKLLVTETGAKAVAEGVETADDLEMVVRAGFDAAQGYALGPPDYGFEPATLPEDPRQTG